MSIDAKANRSLIINTCTPLGARLFSASLPLNRSVEDDYNQTGEARILLPEHIVEQIAAQLESIHEQCLVAIESKMKEIEEIHPNPTRAEIDEGIIGIYPRLELIRNGQSV